MQIPLFVLAGEIMNRGGLTQRLIEWSLAIVGHVRGALSHVAILTNLILAGVSGSAVADAVATGKPLIPAMRKRGYKGSYAAAVIAAGALLGPIIPPSIPMVVYAQIANVSVIRMFLSGVVPGLMLAAGFFALCTVIARRRGYPAEQRTDFAGKVRATGRASWALAMPLLIILGIRAGLFTETEVAAAVVLYALVVSLVVYRDMKAGELPALILEAGRTSAVILFLLAAAGPFSWLVAETQVSEHLVAGIRTISDHPIVILLIVNLLLLVVGSLLEPLPAMVIFLPALLPIGAATRHRPDPLRSGHRHQPDDRHAPPAGGSAQLRRRDDLGRTGHVGRVGDACLPRLVARRAVADRRLPAADHLVAGDGALTDAARAVAERTLDSTDRRLGLQVGAGGARRQPMTNRIHGVPMTR